MTEEPKHYELLLAVTGGIAAYKSAMLCSQLRQREAGVTVVMTANAEHFVGRLTFSTLSGRKVYTNLFNDRDMYKAGHISLTETADLIVVAPATANIIAKMAGGICDDLASTILVSADSDILLAPAMNARMWQNSATQRNIEILRNREGVHFVGPVNGRLADGTEGVGRMSEPEEIIKKITKLLKKKNPKGL
ncbi:MAG: phosphopantothenoylcysteine decarboxylase [Sedimentisphaerales bacterium]|nr:phosphopantothenoylcysteine decarboxylase [Sedimentisphaerales bacterium]